MSTPDRTLTFASALSQAQTQAAPTPTLTSTPVPPTATSTPAPTATPTVPRTPPALPGLFTSDLLDRDVVPQTYVTDQCQYLKNRWNPANSPPGTVVMAIMYHSITKDDRPLLPDGSQVHHSDLVKTLERAHELGFETITAEQLAAFVENNALIPARSLLIIVDDRKTREYYDTHFIPFLKKFNWTITNAWISAVDTPEYLWDENKTLQDEGWVDHQAHGVVHNIPMGDFSNDDFMRGELDGSMKAIEAHFGKKPVAFIWPGGGFSKRAAELAREAGYRIGFTTNPRGPILYNWIPQAAEKSDAHPYWMPEIPAADPLMTLPRYWSSDAVYHLEDVIAIGAQAAAQADQYRAVELDYYEIACAPITGPIEGANP